MKLTFYLFNETVTDFDDALVHEKFDGDHPFEEIAVNDGLPFEAKAYFQQNRETAPKWLGFIAPHCQLNQHEIKNTTNSFLLLLKTSGRIFAVTAGYGFTAINRSRLETGFGLRLTLNAIDPKKIKSVDARRIDTTTKQKRVLMNNDSPLYDFEFDLDEDLLNLISGQPRDDTLASKLAGSDSLSLTGEFTFPQLGEKCDALLAEFQKTDYKEHFGFIDHLRLVKDPALLAELDAKLLDALEARSDDGLMLAYPEIDNWGQIEQFRVSCGHQAKFVQEVNLAEIYAFLDEHGLQNVDPQKIGIIGLDHDNHAVTKRFTLHEYCVFETEHKGRLFLLSLRKWFELAKDYVEEVNAAMDAVDEIDKDGFLPAMQPGEREEDYNERAANGNNELICLDQHNFQLPGHSKIEVCDLLSEKSEFICVKKYNESQTLSHLFSQGFVSLTLLNDHPEYRQFTREQCPANWDLPFNEGEVRKDEITYIFAIAKKHDQPLARSLPFFSKVNLRHTRKAIERLGYKMQIYRIRIEDSD